MKLEHAKTMKDVKNRHPKAIKIIKAGPCMAGFVRDENDKLTVWSGWYIFHNKLEYLNWLYDPKRPTAYIHYYDYIIG